MPQTEHERAEKAIWKIYRSKRDLRPLDVTIFLAGKRAGLREAVSDLRETARFLETPPAADRGSVLVLRNSANELERYARKLGRAHGR